MKNIVLVLGLTLITVSAWSHDEAHGVVKERMDLMDNLKGAMKSLKPIMRGKKVYNVDTVKKNALVILNNAGGNMTKLFPEGSLQKPSEASPSIWTQWQEFQRIANKLKRLGQALHDVAEKDQGMGDPKTMANPNRAQGMMGNPDQARGLGMATGVRGAEHGLDNMSDQQLASMPANGLIRMIGQSCSACHKKYRVEK